MTLPADYHMHTALCRHAVGRASDYAAQALRTGLDEIGFSDHCPMVRDDFDDWRMRLDQLDEYVEQVRQAQRDHPSLTIRLGLEVDFLPGNQAWVRELAARHPWDYFIGSVHYVDESWDIDNPKRISEWEQRDPWDVWASYFELLTQAAQSGLFEIIGHADLCKKFCFYPRQDPTPLFERFLRAVGAAGSAIELNTAGLRKDCREIYPSRAFLACAASLGVPVTFGSDAHAPEEVGMSFAEAVSLARDAGYSRYCRFRQRQRQVLGL
jgi:histidinol-phosphatase (PHP family)